jgi:Flp pilus assembly protein TadD
MLAASSFLFTACASTKEPQLRFDEGMYQQILDRQKAGMAVDEDHLAKLPEMGAGDHERLGDSYFHQGNFAMAVVEYNKALGDNPNQTLVLYKRGLVFLKQRRWKDASTQFQELLKTEPKSALAYEGLGYADLQMGQDGKAEEELRQAITLDATRWQAHNFLGLLYDHQRRYRDAIAEFQAALAVQPGESAVHNNLGLAYYLTGQYDAAVGSFQEALRIGSGHPKIYNNLGLAYGKLERYHEALESFKMASEESQAYNNLGAVYLAAGNPRQAITCFEKAIDLHPRHYPKAAENLDLARRALNKQHPPASETGENGAASCP